MEAQKMQIAKAILSKKSNMGDITTILDFKLHYRAMANKKKKNSVVLAQKQT
jgi:hypothetical protein